MSLEEFVPNERLRWARNLKGWSQAELAEKVGTSFEMVSRWERGVTVPSPHYRRRLGAVLGQTPEELGLVRDVRNSFTAPSSPFVLLASSHADAEKAIVSHVKTALQERGIILWSSRQIGKQRNGNTQATLREVVHAAHAILVVISPQSRSSRHVREALEMVGRYQRPLCGIWIEGERWEECLPEERVELTALVDARERDTPITLEEIATALEQVLFASQDSTEAVQLSLPDTTMEVVTLTNHPTEMQISQNPHELPAELVPTQSKKMEVVSPPSQRSLEPTNGAKPLPADLPQPTPPNIYAHQGGLSRSRVGLLIGLAILVVGGGILGSLSLLTHFGVLGAHSGPSAVQAARGGTWTYGIGGNVHSLIPNGTNDGASTLMDQALYLPSSMAMPRVCSTPERQPRYPPSRMAV